MTGTATLSADFNYKEPIFPCLYCNQKKVRLKGH